MTTNPSNITDPSNVDPNSNPPVNVTNPTPNVGQGTPEELKQQLVEAQQKLAKFEDEAFKAREKERKRKEQEAADKAALEAKLKEQGEFKTLADNLAAEKQRLEQEIAQRDAEIAKRDHEALRAKIATKHGLAPEFAARLNGATEAELEADAIALKALVVEQTQQALSKQQGNKPGPPAGKPTQEQAKQQMTKKLGTTGIYRNF
jgi:hypothetical protein